MTGVLVLGCDSFTSPKKGTGFCMLCRLEAYCKDSAKPCTHQLNLICISVMCMY